MKFSRYTKSIVKDNIELVDQGRYKELLLLVPYNQREELVILLQECEADVDISILKELVGIHPNATKKERELYDYAISLGCSDDDIVFNEASGFSIKYKDEYKFNVIDNNDGTFYCYVSSLRESNSSKETVKFNKVKTIIRRAISGYSFSYVIR